MKLTKTTTGGAVTEKCVGSRRIMQRSCIIVTHLAEKNEDKANTGHYNAVIILGALN